MCLKEKNRIRKIPRLYTPKKVFQRQAVTRLLRRGEGTTLKYLLLIPVFTSSRPIV